ncbi:MAG: DNA-binding response regulator [Acidobacteria bacterium]|nr:MAG: DNA-binding response regulator [Acidobacteriota bacterium]REJ98024.1 MAG: DNA-binding response regulator [Acidobacteriota bacterium]REK16767.1 MAG: DNA-binding response regulator [Acidobacteriota bacterium]REK42678.1 MAG: DNA-binding response regulator [Acidobacteriota bacterium]
MKQTILIFGLLAATIFLLFELNKYSLSNQSDATEIFIVLTGVAFVAIGFLLSRFFSREEKHEKRKNLKESDLTKQEQKVLALVAEGMSNSEIGEELFIAESTVKTHVSNILSKLQAKRRTEAVKIGRELEII